MNISWKEALVSLALVGFGALAIYSGPSLYNSYKHRGDLVDSTLYCKWDGGLMRFKAKYIRELADRKYLLENDEGEQMIAQPPFAAPCAIGKMEDAPVVPRDPTPSAAPEVRKYPLPTQFGPINPETQA